MQGCPVSKHTPNKRKWGQQGRRAAPAEDTTGNLPQQSHQPHDETKANTAPPPQCKVQQSRLMPPAQPQAEAPAAAYKYHLCPHQVLRLFAVLLLVIIRVHCARSTPIVTRQEDEEAELTFHFPFVSGPEDLHVSIMKMESIDDTNSTVICALKQGAVVYQADQYRDRTEIHNDLSNGNLNLILKHVEESDAGFYKCQASNKKNHDEKMIKLCVKMVEVSTYLHGAVTLPCSFSFINGPDDLHVSWVKKNPEKIVHSYHDGEDDLTDQDTQFQGRTKMSISFYKGNVDLTLKNVGFEDEGIYSCHAANKNGHGEVYFRISIDRLHGEDPVVLLVADGKKKLKCSSVGFYKEAEIIWQNKALEDLSEFTNQRSRILQPDGRIRLESTLNVNVEPNVHYFCRVQEGRLRRSTRAVLSDGEHSINMRNEL